MPDFDVDTLAVKPIYAVLFATVDDVDAPYSPIVTQELGDSSLFTVPHGLDLEMAAALPGLWYCLHLPSTLSELIDISARALKTSQNLDLDHRIIVAPITIFDREHLGEWPPLTAPALTICPDDLVEDATPKTAALGFPFPPVPFSELSSESLRRHWRAIHSQFAPAADYLGNEPTLATRLDFQPIDLPRRRLARQWAADQDQKFVADGDVEAMLDDALWRQVVLAGTARLEEEGATPEELESRMPRLLEEEGARLRIPMAVGLPGVPSVYARRAFGKSLHSRIHALPAVDEGDTWSIVVQERPDSLIERSAIEFVTAHRALARGGVGLMLPSLPQRVFTVLAALEKHLMGTPRGPQVRRLLEQLQEAAVSIWRDTPIGVIARASSLTVFSNFPLGLLRLPGDTAPLSCRVPISYRPLLPLTRTVQFELLDARGVDLTGGLNVLVAECIPAADPVGRQSRLGWKLVGEMLGRAAPDQVTFNNVETPTLDALRAAIANSKPEILVLSAHGAVDKFGSTAGIIVGDSLCLGPELGQMPSVVILSACHVAPRGGGAITVTDLLLREGAVAVLGTQVPVDVNRNAMLMGRFLYYMSEALAEREQHSSMLEVWHRVQTSNAINDILDGSVALARWGHDRNQTGGTVLEEFMNARSVGEIRPGHVYEDTERVLKVMADELGDGSRVRSLLRSPGYVPESLFYLFAGRPERVFLRPPIAMPREVWEGMRQGRKNTSG